MEFLNVGGRSWEELALAKDLIHMGHNCNHLKIHDAIHEAMIKAIEADDYRNYAPPYGFGELRELIKKDLNIPDVEVMVTQGATEAIYQAMASILKPRRRNDRDGSGLAAHRQFCPDAQIQSCGSAGLFTEHELQASARPASKLHNDSTKLISIIDPLNPLGSAYSEDEIKALCEFASAAEFGCYTMQPIAISPGRDISRRCAITIEPL